MALGDVDRDGDLDLVAGNDGQANRLYLNNGTADPFSGVSGTDITDDYNTTQAVALGDVDSDGDLDLVVGNDGENCLYLNNSTADPFSGVSGTDITGDADKTTSVALGDVNGDGRPDLVAGNGGEFTNQVNRLYLNDGSPTPVG
ncbi:MAG: VCBS repeat-containing protein [Chloroflexi bacterium]|nr:VCBS repeat-containing protein [Chloroflexota bacterium]